MTTSANEEQKLRKALAGSTGTTTYNTYRDRAEAAIAQEAQGRQAAASKASVVGTEAAVRYPKLPADNPFTTDISGVEPPTGIDINWQEPNGTPAEVAQSLLATSSIPLADVAKSADEIDIHSVSSGAQAPASGCLPEAGAFPSPNVIADPSSDNPTNAEVGGEAGRGDVGGGITGHGVEGSPSITLARGAASTFIRRRRL
jgi:hypothetical protein